MLQLKPNRPFVVGVNSIVSVPVSGRTFAILNSGMVNARMHPRVLSVTSVNRTGTPAFSVVAEALYPLVVTVIVTFCTPFFVSAAVPSRERVFTSVVAARKKFWMVYMDPSSPNHPFIDSTANTTTTVAATYENAFL